MGRGCKSRCVQVGRKNLRWIMAKLRGGMAELRVHVESGRWVGLSTGEVEDVQHFLLRCSRMARERAEVKKQIEKIVVNWFSG